jgi:translocation and assembly module TamB
LTRTRESGVSSYKASLNVNKFQTGKLLKQEKVFGPISLTADVDGSGLSMEELNTKVNLKILSFIYQKYEYKNFTLDGSLKKYFFSGLAVLPDENLDVRLKGDLDYNESVPRYRFTLELKNADFKALNFSERPLKARGTIDVDLATSDFRLINGDLAIRKFAVFNGKDMYAVDSLLFASIDQEGQSEIKVQSDIVDANFKGTINLYSLPEVIKRHFNQYFSMHDTAFDKPADAQDFKFDLKIKNTDLLTEILIPDLDPFIPGEIMGEFDSKAHRMDLRIGLAKMGYAGVKADSISFDVMSDRERLGYTLAVRKISRDTIRMEALKLEGNVANDSIRTKLVILDSLQKDKYVLGGVFHSLEKVFQFRFLENEVIMNYAPWTTPPDNSLQFTSKGMLAHNFSITNINEMIALKTSNDADSIVSIVFKDLNLQNITKLVEGATPIDGLANGDLNMMSSESGAFTTSLTIADLNILDHPWGDLSLALGQTSSGPLNIDLRLESDGTSLKAAGYYTSKVASPKINFVTEITKFDLASIEPLTLGQLKNTKGQLKGEVRITGDAKQPDINGTLNFTDASFTPSTINTEFILEDETITIKDRQMLLSNFEIKDQENNLAKIEGDISWTESQDFDLNLDLNATNFQVLNSTEKDNELFYGKVRLSTKAKITGNLNQPVIDMNINLSDESNFTYVIPQSEKGVLEQQGIVVFVDRDAKDDPFLAGIDPRDTIKSTFRGIDLSANIELNDKETFNIIIDPLTGDKLSVKGNSTLTLDMDPTGDMFLSGRYEISEGSYDLSFYKFVKRKFLIEKGSTITWSGSPTDADMNIRAINEVETAPIDLFVTGDDSDEQLNMYKQRLNFLVYLIIKGQMLSPENRN